jgi:hypothetical protein
MPQGEAWKLLNGYPIANRFVPGDTEAIATWLENALRSHVSDRTELSTGDFDIRSYSRDFQTGQLAAIFDAVCQSTTKPSN